MAVLVALMPAREVSRPHAAAGVAAAEWVAGGRLSAAAACRSRRTGAATRGRHSGRDRRTCGEASGVRYELEIGGMR